MKHLEKFFDYILESADSGRYTIDKLNEILVPIRDMGIDVSIEDYQGLEKSITEGEFSGRKFITINFYLKDFSSGAGFGSYTTMIDNDKVWEFLDELITFKSRLQSDKVCLYFSIRNDYPRFSISFLTDGEVDSDLFELEKFYNSIRRKGNSGTTDFYHGLVMTLDKENKTIKINASMSYTDRKLNNLFRGLDISKFDIKKELRDSYGDKAATILVTLKP
jgi:hypothetical protein